MRSHCHLDKSPVQPTTDQVRLVLCVKCGALQPPHPHLRFYADLLGFRRHSSSTSTNIMILDADKENGFVSGSGLGVSIPEMFHMAPIALPLHPAISAISDPSGSEMAEAKATCDVTLMLGKVSPLTAAIQVGGC